MVEADCDHNRSDANDWADSSLLELTMELESTPAFIVYVDVKE